MNALLRITLGLLVLGTALAVPMSGNAQKNSRERRYSATSATVIAV
jgi:hypothetical protein